MKTQPLKITREVEQEAIQNCENEAIQNIGSIQPFGFLLAIDSQTMVVTYASQNCSDWFDRPIEKILEMPITDILPEEIIHQCNNALAHSTISSQREHVGRIQKDNSYCEIFVHLKNDILIIELQKTDQKEFLNIKLLDQIQLVSNRFEGLSKTQTLLEYAVDDLRAISGFHRVKAYKFLSDGSGEVVAESREPQTDTFLGTRFPASDVPQAAKKLYTSTPIRVIPSVKATQVAIASKKSNGASLDLSLAILRGVPDVHLMYLQNMGVKGSLSLPIVLDGKLWGLFAFHHEEELMLNAEVLTTLEILGKVISSKLSTVIQRQHLLTIKDATRVASSLFTPDDSSAGFSISWETSGPDLAKLIKCHGVCLVGNDEIDIYGICPKNKAIRQLVDRLQAEFNDGGVSLTPIAIESINVKYPDIDSGDIAGVLAIPHPAKAFSFLMYFRKETAKTVKWAGEPSKDIHKTKDGYRLHPRNSFAEYINIKQKQSDPFDAEEMAIAESLRDLLLKVLSYVLIQTEHRTRQLDLVVRELNHRVRNTLALVNSIISQSRTNTNNIDEYISNLEKRIQALSETQKLLTEFNWKNVQVKELFKRALISCQDHINSRVMLSGANISLPPTLASVLALVLSELSSNAIKYGALSNNSGRINLKWSTSSDQLMITWTETGGPIITEEPTRKGFGTTLIRDALAYEFGAQCDFKFLPEGVKLTYQIPLKDTSIRIENTTKQIPVNLGRFKPFNAFVLEDDYLVARNFIDILKTLGASKVDAAPTLQTATKNIEEGRYDVAFLDANIHGKDSISIGEMLKQKDVPFAFVTGYGSKDQKLNKTPSLGVLSKPINKEDLINVLSKADITEEHG